MASNLFQQLQTIAQQKLLPGINALPSDPPQLKPLLLAAYNASSSEIKPLYTLISESPDPEASALTRSPSILLKALLALSISRENIAVVKEFLALTSHIKPLFDDGPLGLVGSTIWSSSNPEIWSLMLQSGYLTSDSNDDDGGAGLSTPLSDIIHLKRKNYRGLASVLLKHGAKPQLTHFKAAVKMGDIKLLDILWDCFPEGGLSDCRLLHEAVAFGKVEAIRWLLETGKMDVNLIPSEGPRGGNEEFGEGGEVNGTALHTAVVYNEIAALRFLVKMGARTDLKNESGRTAYQEARERGRWMAVGILQFK